MTPGWLAAIHARAMVVPRPWSAGEFDAILKSPGCVVAVHEAGFALGRVILDEAELLSFAVDPDQQRRGLGRICLQKFHDAALAKGAKRGFLEVAATNTPALGLYLAAGYEQTGMRKAYYRAPDGTRIDAILMAKGLIS